jgi:hypothetical protein
MPSLLRNCRLGEGCHRTWNSLQPTADEAVRHCSECREKVYHASSEKELWSHLKLGRCVAITVPNRQKGHFLGGPRHYDYQPRDLLNWED